MKGRKIEILIHLRSSVILLLSVVLCAACTDRELYNSQTAVSADGWEMHDFKSFVVEIPQNDCYDIEMFVRHDSEYEYRNLWLFIDHIKPDSTFATDTLNIELADAYGRWLGGGWGSYHQMEFPVAYKMSLDSGTHQIRIKQAMREYKLKGVANVGVKVIRSKEPHQ